MGQLLKYEEFSHYDYLLRQLIDKEVKSVIGTTPKSNYIRFLTNASSVSFELKGTGSVEVTTPYSDEVYEICEDGTTIEVNTLKSDEVVIAGVENITSVDLSDCNLTDVIFSDNTSIERLKLQNNHLSQLNVRPLKNLRYFHIYNNPIVDDCLVSGFKESDQLADDDLEEMPIVDKDSDSYHRLLDLMDQLDSRLTKSIGSIVLYPWYGLETLVYKADGYHYKAQTYDFTSAPTSATAKVKKGVVCKYPRRLRFVSPYNDNRSNYKSGNFDFGVSPRNTPGEWYTDEPLSEVIYSSSDQEDTHRSLNEVVDGFEFKSGSETSILYAFIRGYGINDPTKNSDVKDQSLDYYQVTRGKTLVRHPLTKYNELRKALEKDITVNKNWFFGSAIQDTEDYQYCPYYFKINGVQDIWESVQKGFGRTWGLHDLTSGNQPDWNHKNIVRFTHFRGNICTAKVPVKFAIGQYDSGQVYRTDYRLPYYSNAQLTGSTKYSGYRWDGRVWSNNRNIDFGHGDHIVSYLLSQGDNLGMWDGNDISFKLFGICPNSMGYILDRGRSNSLPTMFTLDTSRAYIDHSNPAGITASSGTLPYIYRKLTDPTNYLYTTMRTVQETVDGVTTYTAQVTENEQILPSQQFKGCRDIESGSFHLSMKELYEHCDSSSMSWTMSDNSYFRYLNGRFGERRYVAQSSGNSGDGCEASTEDYAYSEVYGPFGDFNALSTYKYHVTSFHASALSPGGHTARFPQSSSAISRIGSSFMDYVTGIGTGCQGYNVATGGLSGKSGTSMSCPISAAMITLAMNLYKLIYPNYLEEPEYGPDKTSSSIVVDTYGRFTGGFGRFSPFMDYVSEHWMSRPENSMTHQMGRGSPNFTVEPSVPFTRQPAKYSCSSTLSLKVGDVGTPFEIPDRYKFRYTVVSTMKKNTSYPAFSFDCVVVNSQSNSSKLMPVVPGTYRIYLCDNVSTYGMLTQHIISDNNFERPEGYSSYGNTYNYYPVTVTAESNPLELISKDFLVPEVGEDSYITVPSDSKRFTIQMKIKFDSSILDDNGAVETSYSPVIFKTDISKMRYSQVKFSGIVVSGTSVNINNSAVGYQIRSTQLRRVIPARVNNIPVSVYTEDEGAELAGSMVSYLGHILTTTRSYVFTFTVKDGSGLMYINGNEVASFEYEGPDLSKTVINGNLLTPKTTSDLKAKVNDNLLVYDRVLNDYEIAYNSAYLLQKE